jgi:hypothetical protein
MLIASLRASQSRNPQNPPSAAADAAWVASETRLRRELNHHSAAFIQAIDGTILPHLCQDDPARGYFHRLRADYRRYQLEASFPAGQLDSPTAIQWRNEALDSYNRAVLGLFDGRRFRIPGDQHARERLAALVLNYSVFLRDIHREADAIGLANFGLNYLSFDAEAMSLDDPTPPAEEHVILALLLGNVTQWDDEDHTKFYAWRASRGYAAGEGHAQCLSRLLWDLANQPA